MKLVFFNGKEWVTPEEYFRSGPENCDGRIYEDDEVVVEVVKMKLDDDATGIDLDN